MKMNITITEENCIRNEEIVEIEICNGNWKYWDNMMETTEKESLTINTITKSGYLQMPVKDTYKIHNRDAWEERREIVVEEVHTRTYDSLLEFLNYRIENVKDWYNKFGDTVQTKKCTIFDLKYVQTDEDSTEKDITYRKDKDVTIKFEVIE